jgi:hypothetical protein
VKWQLRLIGTCLVLLVSALPASVTWQYIYDTLQGRAFDKITRGMSEAEVVALAGTPLYSTDGSLGPDGHPIMEHYRKSGCERQLWYAPRLGFGPSKWSYCFNDAGELVDNFHWVSW